MAAIGTGFNVQCNNEEEVTSALEMEGLEVGGQSLRVTRTNKTLGVSAIFKLVEIVSESEKRRRLGAERLKFRGGFISRKQNWLVDHRNLTNKPIPNLQLASMNFQEVHCLRTLQICPKIQLTIGYPHPNGRTIRIFLGSP